MAVAVTIRVNKAQQRELNRVLKGYPRQIKTIVSRAAGRAAKTGRKVIVDEITTDATVKKKTVRRAIKTKRTFGSTPGAEIIIFGKSILLTSFKARQNSKGVSVTVRRSQGRKLIRHAFIRDKNGVKLALIRARGPGGRLVPRTPIRALYGPNAVDLFNNTPGVAKRSIAKTTEAFEKRIASGIQLFLSKRVAR